MSDLKSQTSKELLFFECLFLLCLGLCFFAVFFFIAESKYNHLFSDLPKPSEQKSSKQKANTNSQIPFATLNKQEEPKSNTGNQQAKTDHESLDTLKLARERRDVTAQEGMWRAANHLVVLTFFQVILGTSTLVFLAWTLKTQRGELKEARNVTKSQRAYLNFSSFEVLQVANGIVVRIAYTNYGQTPAKSCHVSLGHAVIKDTGEQTTIPDVEINTFHRENSDGSFVAPNQNFPNEFLIEDASLFDEINSAKAQIVVVVRIEFHTIYGRFESFTDVWRVFAQVVQIDNMGAHRVGHSIGKAKVGEITESANISPEFWAGEFPNVTIV